jgi:SSS family solute:Na+ symporter
MGIVDIVVFVGFIAAVMAVGLWKSKSAHSEEGGAADYFLAGRGLSWWLIGVSLIAANISAEQFVGMSGSASQHVGLAIASYEWMAAVTLVIVAFAFLPYFLKTGIYTIPGFLEHRYNKTAKSIMAVFMMVILIGVSLCGVIYAGALPMRELLLAAGINLNLTACCWIMGLLAAAYVAAGGLKACAWADLIQGIALIIGGAFIAYFAFQALGLADPAQLTAGIAKPIKEVAVSAITAETGTWARFTALNVNKLHMFLPATDSYLPFTALIIGLWIPNLYYWGLNQYITQRTLGSSSLAQGQRGIVFAAALKLVIPFIIVFPGIIAFNLYSHEMADRAADDHLRKIEAKVDVAPDAETFAVSAEWKKTHTPDQLKLIEDFNAAVTAKAAASTPAASTPAADKAPAKIATAYKTDTALGLLVKNLCMDKVGLFGFIIAALLGAIVSSLAAVLNAASTIFSIDIYKDYINTRATHKQLVAVGRICVGVFVVIGCVVAPRLDNPALGGIFKYIQEFQGFVSPGILAVFVFGILNRTAPAVAGVTGLLLSPVIFGLMYFGKFSFLPTDMNNRMAITLGIIFAVMTVIGLAKPLPQPVEFHSNTHLDLTSSKGAKLAGLAVVVATAILYVVFR